MGIGPPTPLQQSAQVCHRLSQSLTTTRPSLSPLSANNTDAAAAVVATVPHLSVLQPPPSLTNQHLTSPAPRCMHQRTLCFHSHHCCHHCLYHSYLTTVSRSPPPHCRCRRRSGGGSDTLGTALHAPAPLTLYKCGRTVMGWIRVYFRASTPLT